MKKIKIFTYVDRPNSFFLRFWIDYYSKFLGSQLTVLYRNSSLQKINSDRINVIDVSNFFNGSHINEWIPPIDMFLHFQEEFLKKYDVVIYTDLDEFIIHENINEIIQNDFQNPLVTNGLEIIQNVFFEKKFDFGKKIAGQRHFMIRSSWYDKPIIINSKTNWCVGLHNHNKYEKKINDLYLVHLGRICREKYIELTESTRKLYPNSSFDHWITNNLNEYYLEKFVCNKEQQLEEIPEKIIKLIDKII